MQVAVLSSAILDTSHGQRSDKLGDEEEEEEMIYKLDDEGLQVEQLVLIRPLGVGDTDTHHGINGPVI